MTFTSEQFQDALHACMRGNLSKLQELLTGTFATNTPSAIPATALKPVTADVEAPLDCATRVLSPHQFQLLVHTAFDKDQSHLIPLLFGLLKCPITSDQMVIIPWDSLGLRHLDATWVDLDIVVDTKQSLRLAHNRLTSLPVAFLGLLTGLQHLNLNDNLLRFLPADDQFCEGGFQHLTKLELGGNQLAKLPMYLFRIHSLVELSVAHNVITDLPSDEPWEVPSLEILDLSHNKLTQLCAQIFSSPKLKTLLAQHNSFQEIPDGCSSATLSVLDLSHNPLEKSPNPVHFPMLSSLTLDATLIETVPRSVIGLDYLRVLHLQDNLNITRFPIELGAVPGLAEIHIKGTPVSNFPEDIRAWASPGVVVQYLQQTFDSGVSSPVRFRVPVLGGPGVGKSTMLHNLCGNGGTLKYRPGGFVFGSGNYLTFDFWEVGNDLEYALAHRVFLDVPQVYIVVWNTELGVSGIEDLRGLLGDIQARAPGSAVVIAGTFSDRLKQTVLKGAAKTSIRQHFEEMTQVFRQQYAGPAFPHIVDVCELSKGGQGIGALKDRLYLAAHHLETSLGTFDCPKSFLAFLEGLQSHAKDSMALDNKALTTFLSSFKYLESAPPQETISFYLELAHRRRLVYWYQDEHDAAKDTLFLDVAKLSQFLATVLSEPTCLNGILQRPDLVNVLSDMGVAEHISAATLPILVQNEFLLPLDGTTEYLCPVLLPAGPMKEPPSFLKLMPTHQVFSRRWTFVSFPSGLMKLVTSRILSCIFNGFGMKGPSAIPTLLCNHCDRLGSSTLTHSTLFNLDVMWLWSTGLAYCFDPDSKDCFAIRESVSTEGSCLELNLLASGPEKWLRAGALLSHIHSHINHAVQDLYPHLLSSQFDGQPKFEAQAPCHCTQQANDLESNLLTEFAQFTHHLAWDRCEDAALTSESESVVCRHSGGALYVPLRDLAPDLLVSEALSKEPSPRLESVTGGKRRTGSYLEGMQSNGSSVLVKTYSHPQDVYRESQMLLQLNHPSLMLMTSCWKSPLCVGFSHPPVGNLKQVLRGLEENHQRFAWPVCQAIVSQAADALDFLRSRGIIYQNFTTESVFLFSFDLQPGFAKLSEAGVHSHSSADHLACQAPELLRPLNTSFPTEKSLTFSLALVLYEISVADPFPGSKAEDIRRILLAGHRPTLSPVSTYVRAGIVDLLGASWSQDPDERPTLEAFRTMLNSPDINKLRAQLDAPKGCCLETAAQTFNSDAQKILWVSCGDTFSGQVLQIKVGDSTVSPSMQSGFWVRSSRILCCDIVNSSIWLGTQSGELLEYLLEAETPVTIWSEQLADCVLSVVHVAKHDCVLVGLANGRLHQYYGLNEPFEDVTLASIHGTPANRSMEDVSIASAYDLDMDSLPTVTDRDMHVFELKVGQPVSSLALVGDLLWCGTKNSITVLELPTIQRVCTWATSKSNDSDASDILSRSYGYDEEPRAEDDESPSVLCHDLSELVIKLVPTPRGVLSAVRRDCILCLWDSDSHQLITRVDCAEFARSSTSQPPVHAGSPHAVSCCNYSLDRDLTIVGLRSGDVIAFHGANFMAPVLRFCNPKLSTVRILHLVEDDEAALVLVVGGDGEERGAGQDRAASQLLFVDI